MDILYPNGINERDPSSYSFTLKVEYVEDNPLNPLSFLHIKVGEANVDTSSHVETSNLEALEASRLD